MVDEGIASHMRYEELVSSAIERLGINDLRNEILIFLDIYIPKKDDDKAMKSIH